jgi:GTP-binding protein Era
MTEPLHFAVVGHTNAGKTSLLRTLTRRVDFGQVSDRPGTTRHAEIVDLRLDGRVVARFIDTPGLHHGARRALNRAMNRTAASALADADVCVFVVEALRWTREDDLVLEHLKRDGRVVIAAVNKVDRANPRERLLPFLQELSHRQDFVEIIPISAVKGTNLAPLVQAIARRLPLSPPLFPVEQVTDRDLKFRISELIREKLTLELDQELPYGIAVEIEALGDEEGQLVVNAAIWVERDGQKAIVIGTGGERLKRVGSKARMELNRILGRRLHLTLWVKVRESWADNARALTQLGLE